MAGKIILQKKPRGPGVPAVSELLVTCPGGAESTLRKEIEELGLSVVATDNGAIRVAADISHVHLLNRMIRTGSRVLVPVLKFVANDFDTLYAEIRSFPWERYLPPERTFMIVAATRSPDLTDHRFLAMRTKDAIVDRQRNAFDGVRSSVDKERPALIINVFAGEQTVELSLDSTGAALHERGYRREAGDAPLRETVAAMIALEADIRAQDARAVLDPFCGAGTIVIEAALIRQGRGPGTLGRSFAWERWPWRREMRDLPSETSKKTEYHRSAAPLIGTDIDPGVIAIARRNAERAGVGDMVRFEVAGFEESIARWCKRDVPGVIVSNPPYGVRLAPENLTTLYRDLGTVLRSNARGWDLLLLGAENRLIREVKMKPQEVRHVFNGALSCTLNRYQIF